MVPPDIWVPPPDPPLPEDPLLFAGGGGAGVLTPITESIWAQVEVVVAEFSICALCCVDTALCIDMPIVSAITVLSMAIDCEFAAPLTNF